MTKKRCGNESRALFNWSRYVVEVERCALAGWKSVLLAKTYIIKALNPAMEKFS
jgi:hypothetical protein